VLSRLVSLKQYGQAVRLSLRRHRFGVNPLEYVRFVEQINEVGRKIVLKSYSSWLVSLSSACLYNALFKEERPLVGRIVMSAGFGWQASDAILNVAGCELHALRENINDLGALTFSAISAMDYLLDETATGLNISQHVAPSELAGWLEEQSMKSACYEYKISEENALDIVLCLLSLLASKARSLAISTGNESNWTRFAMSLNELYARELRLCETRELQDRELLEAQANERLAQGQLALEMLWHVMTLAGIENSPALRVARRIGEVIRLADDIEDALNDYLNSRPNMLLLRGSIRLGPDDCLEAYIGKVEASVRELMDLIDGQIPGLSPGQYTIIRHFNMLSVARGVNWKE
jgi:hypothetical protein